MLYRLQRNVNSTHEACPKSIQPFWISREPVARPWCNLAAGQRRPYYASIKSLSCGASQLAVRRRWLSLCTVEPSHSQWPTEQISFITTMFLPILQLSCSFFFGGEGAKHHITQVCQSPYNRDLSLCDFWLFWKLKSPLKVGRVVNTTVTQYTSSVNSVSLPND